MANEIRHYILQFLPLKEYLKNCQYLRIVPNYDQILKYSNKKEILDMVYFKKNANIKLLESVIKNKKLDNEWLVHIFYRACHRDTNLIVVKYLYNVCNVCSWTEKDKNTLLDWTSSCGNISALKYFNEEEKVNFTDKRSAMRNAIDCERKKIIKYLHKEMGVEITKEMLKHAYERDYSIYMYVKMLKNDWSCIVCYNI